MLNGVRLSDVEYIRDMLKDTPDVDPDQVDGVIDMLKRDMQKRGNDEGSIRHAKHRVSFDETHAMDVPGVGRVSIADLYSNDAHGLTGRYIRTMSGAIGLARVGIKSDSDFARSLRESISSLGESGADADEIRTVRQYAEGLHKMILARPLDDAQFGGFAKLLKRSRDYAFARSMGRGGFSILPSLVRPWTNGYAKYALQNLPALGEIFSSRTDGQLNSPLMHELESFTGLGADSVSMSVFSRFDHDDTDRWGNAVEAAAHGLKVAGRATSFLGGMTPGLVFGKRLMATAILSRIVRNAFGEADLPESRLAMMGLDRPVLGRIADQLRQHAPAVEGNYGPIRSVNLASWTDLDARDAMLTGIWREASTLIHSENIGATGLWMNKPLGRLISQLRRFPLMAMHLQLARALNDRDFHALNDFMLTSSVAALSGWVQAQAMSKGMDAGQREAFLKDHASLPALLADALERNPYSGLVPQLIDSVASPITGHPVFDGRASGPNSGFQVPALSAATSLTQLMGEAMRNGSTPTRGEARSLVQALPLGNSIPMVWAANALSANLPKEERGSGHKGPWINAL
ncbi:MAG: hypothetical protein GJU76_06680 [Gallionella sp.]|jgi:hypothetical protein|nr:hypothetical protein [Gallionella sp.]